MKKAKQDTAEHALAEHIVAILDHPKTPATLYNALTAFITDGVNIPDSTGETLLERLNRSAETIEYVINVSNEQAEPNDRSGGAQ